MPGVDPSERGTPGTTGRNRMRGGIRRAARRLPPFLPALLWPLTAGAQERAASGLLPSSFSVGTLEVMQLAIFSGVMGAALLSAIWLIRERGRTAAENLDLRARVADLSASLRRADALLNLRDQRVVVWPQDDGGPDIVGALPEDCGAPAERSAFLAFGRWLTPRSAHALERAATALRDGSREFDLTVETRNGALLEVHGRQAPLHTAVRFSSLSQAQREHARLKLDHQQLVDAHESLIGLLGSLPMPVWLRDDGGRLTWVNPAYAKAVGCENAEEAVRESQELLSTTAREEIGRHHLARAVYEQTVSAVVDGDRRKFAVTDHTGPGGSAGMALDTSEIETLRGEFERTVRSHADTLDQLTTAVAIFDADMKLRFFNQAFQKLWDLDVAFLESAPENALVLDRLRSEGKLAEQPEWRRWKESLLSAYRSVDSQEHWWHLPDGRTVRVIATPQPKGGVTWVFENLTEKFDLESRYNAVVRVQGETLDSLAEGVAVFGPDGRLRLSNPAFKQLWSLPDDLAQEDAHISTVRAACDAMAAESPWSMFVAAVTGFDDERRNRHGRTELLNGTVMSYAVIHLPNGQVMMTFVDVTDSVNVERALKEKNEALQKADQLKNDFVQHVSYELRSPLTNIIGFAELLGIETTGPLNERQHEYVDHISSSSSVLLAIVNDILDLATVDAGIMKLDIGEVAIGPSVEAASDLVQERLREHGIRLNVDIARAGDSFFADENRVRQVLFNLLSNAANYAPQGGTITLTATRGEDVVEFHVHDDGPGMSPNVLESIFKRFEPRSNGGRRRGAGLGLSIVKSFVELHGGTVAIETGEGRGTSIICRFPVAPQSMRSAAE